MNNKTKWKSHQLFLWWNDVANLICIVKIWIISPHAKYDIYQNKLVFSSTVNREFAVFNLFFFNTTDTPLIIVIYRYANCLRLNIIQRVNKSCYKSTTNFSHSGFSYYSRIDIFNKSSSIQMNAHNISY